MFSVSSRWPERNLIHCIDTSVGAFSNRDKSFLSSSDRIVSKNLDTVWPGYGPRLRRNPHSSTRSAIVVECRLQKSMGFVRFKLRVYVCAVRNRRRTGRGSFGNYDGPAPACNPRVRVRGIVAGSRTQARVTLSLRFRGGCKVYMN